MCKPTTRNSAVRNSALCLALFLHRAVMFTHDCSASTPFNLIVKYADDTTVLGLITNNNDTACRNEVQHLMSWCDDNYLVLNTTRTKEYHYLSLLSMYLTVCSCHVDKAKPGRKNENALFNP